MKSRKKKLRSLNQAETEISMLSRECLGKDRIATRVTLARRAAAWTQHVNEEQRKITWRFTREKARIKFNYPPPCLQSASA